MVEIKSINWDATYDVAILGFGGAGATAARFAADAGAKVLLVDSAPKGHEGGNTRYSAQLIGTGDDFDETKKYYKRLTYPMELDEKMIDTYVNGMVNMRNYVRQYLGVSPVSIKNDFQKGDSTISLESAVREYPEYPGVNSYDLTVVHKGIFDAALWKLLRKAVVKRSDKIDVWLDSPAKHLIQDPETKAIIGIQIERHHILLNIRALNGVVLTMGGFENNQSNIQDYLGANHLSPLGTVFNKGDGIRMALEVGADLWHMDNYESLGMLHGLSVAVPKGERGQLILQWPDAFNGSIMTIGDDGSRYFNESEPNRHGHIYDHGTWRVPRTNVHPYLVFDQAQYDQIKNHGHIPVVDFFKKMIKSEDPSNLARIIKVNPKIFQQTITTFSKFAKQGHDYEFGRDPKTMRPFGSGPYYALELTNNVLNTQGGPRRNARSEVLNASGHPIPHLYSAGELGGICANQYQGGGNLAECLIFGKIAGENAARIKDDFKNDKMSGAGSSENQYSQRTDELLNNDIKSVNPFAGVKLGPNQYLGVSDDGIGGQVVARVTYVNNKIQNVEIVKQSESGDIGGKAVDELPERMVAQNTYDVDAVSGASTSSRAIKNAVKDALKKIDEGTKVKR
ncbi:FAD-binding protein [Lentilactobacillus raoultii]|uniref:Urocanate reductase n=1 Tax=Lentilactobacillus raoultii TaxID=1987503 RepID=A0ABW3PHU3_9LACO|nr:FAD-binding protein [Lentilactobacillus raoultii]